MTYRWPLIDQIRRVLHTVGAGQTWKPGLDQVDTIHVFKMQLDVYVQEK